MTDYENEDSNLVVTARCHCDTCKGRFLQKIEVKTDIKQGDESFTLCKKCKEEELDTLLIFDRIF